MRRERFAVQDGRNLQTFENELKNLKKLSHRHLIRLIGSYTDVSCVGLLMTPVADMHLGTFMAEAVNIGVESTKIYLRGFFGCLARALEYLHSQSIRHKDIKPMNILVDLKNESVLFADFGTSYNWADDTSGVTNDTVGGFTPKYGSPEAVNASAVRGTDRQYSPRLLILFQSRDWKSDIWSLGCVFLEMCCVLADKHVANMEHFFNAYGTGKSSVRENPEAAVEWVNILRGSFNVPHDDQPLVLSSKMCRYDPTQRPDAAQLVSLIFQFEGQEGERYYSLCCDDQRDSTLSSFDEAPLETGPESGVTDLMALESGMQAPVIYSTTVPFSYHSPLVEDDELTMETLFPSMKMRGNGILEDITILPDDEEATIRPSIPTTFEGTQPSAIGAEPTPLSATPKAAIQAKSMQWPCWKIEDLAVSSLSCPWPRCDEFRDGIAASLLNIDALREHLRAVHGTHDLCWTRFLEDGHRKISKDTGETRNFTTSERKNIGVEPLDTYSALVQSQVTKRSSSRTREIRMDESPSKAADKYTPKWTSSNERNTKLAGLPEASSSQVKPESSSKEVVVQDFSTSDTLEETSVATPEHLLEPMSGCTRVPSYILASRNRFSRAELDSLSSWNRLLNTPVTPRPLFVCGALMFPSILKARAESFIGGEGIYSSRLRRRLQTMAGDWSNMNVSLQDAARRMVPASLKGYSRCQLQSLSYAALIKDDPDRRWLYGDLADPKSRETLGVNGFLISGLSAEALRCLDHLLGSEGRGNLFDKRPAGSIRSDPGTGRDTNSREVNEYREVFERKEVEVAVALRDGGTKIIGAQAFVWETSSFPYTASFKPQDNPWNAKQFVRGKSFARLSDSRNDVSLCMQEEEVAKQIGMIFVKPGDEMKAAVLMDDMEQLSKLVDQGCDVDAVCSVYGTSLQAAAAKGNLKLLELLLKQGANINVKGGQFGTALIAATAGGHASTATRLAQAGADVLAEGGRYISALYQAVESRDLELTHMLLERGAWLTKDYRELLEMANERGSHEIVQELEKYDVRRIHVQLNRTIEHRSILGTLGTGAGDQSVSTGQAEAVRRATALNTAGESRRMSGHETEPYGRKYSAMLSACLAQFFRLKGGEGKWTGIKGVKLLQTALDKGASDSLVNLLGQHLGNVKKLLQILSTVAQERQSRQTQQDDRIEELFESSDTPQLPSISVTQHGSEAGSDVIDHPTTRHRSASDVGPSRLSAVQAIRRPARSSSGQRRSSDTSAARCGSCDGRGGRRGTERDCRYCHGTGRQPSSSSRCRTCNGFGYTFSSSDECRACDGPSKRSRRSSASSSLSPRERR